MDGGEDGAQHRSGDGNLGQLEGDRAGVTHDTGAHLDQLVASSSAQDVTIGALAIRVDRIERRLDLADAPPPRG